MLPYHRHVVEALFLHDVIYEGQWHAWWYHHRRHLDLAAEVQEAAGRAAVGRSLAADAGEHVSSAGRLAAAICRRLARHAPSSAAVTAVARSAFIVAASEGPLCFVMAGQQLQNAAVRKAVKLHKETA